MDCLETDIQMPAPMCPQGHPHGDTAAWGWNAWLGAPFSKGEKERRPQRLTSCGESDGEPKTAEGILKEEIQKLLKGKMSWCCPTWLDIQRDVLLLPDFG